MKSKLSDSQMQVATDIVKQHDFQWWFDRTNVKQAREMLIKKTGFMVSASEFLSIRRSSCEWFKVERRPGPSKNFALTEKEWSQLERAVKSKLHLLQGRTLNEAVAIMCLHCKCNASTLSGVSNKLHVWRK